METKTLRKISEPITERIEKPIHLRLFRYRDLKKFDSWMKRNEDDLKEAWKDYCDKIMTIHFTEYCYNFYKGTLEGVIGNYKNYFE